MSRRIYHYEHEIREIVNKSFIWSYDNSNENYVWSKICSCMDWIQDSQFAIDYYCSTSNKEVGDERFVLYHLGLLQAMAIQQDIIVNLRECLLPVGSSNKEKKRKKKKLGQGKVYQDVNRIRLLVSGHPTEVVSLRAKENAALYSSLSRPQRHGLLSFSIYSEPNSVDEAAFVQNRCGVERVFLLSLIKRHKRWFGWHLFFIYKYMVLNENNWRSKVRVQDLSGEIHHFQYLLRKIGDDFSLLSVTESELRKVNNRFVQLGICDNYLVEIFDEFQMIFEFYKLNVESENCGQVVQLAIAKKIDELSMHVIAIKKELDADFDESLHKD